MDSPKGMPGRLRYDARRRRVYVAGRRCRNMGVLFIDNHGDYGVFYLIYQRNAREWWLVRVLSGEWHRAGEMHGMRAFYDDDVQDLSLPVYNWPWRV